MFLSRLNPASGVRNIREGEGRGDESVGALEGKC